MSTQLKNLVLFAALLLPLAVSAADDTTPVTGLINRCAIALNRAANKAYVVDPGHNAVAILDVAGHSAKSVSVGDDPVAIAFNPANNRVYVANNRGGTVSVLDGRTDAVVATLNVGKLPYAIAANPGENKVYVSNTFSNLLTIIDGVTNKTKTVQAGSADVIVVDSTRDKAYLLHYEDSSLTVVNGADDSVLRMPAGALHLWGMDLDEQAGKLYVNRIGNREVVAIDENSRMLTPIATGKLPCAVAVNASTNTVYVVNYGDDSVTVIHGAKHAAVKTVHVGSHPQAIAVDPLHNRIYVANTHGNSVTVIDGSRNEVVATLLAGVNPYAIALDAANATVVVANMGEPSFTRIDVHRPQ
jgi:YVTN family beta-propeller protein